MNPLVLAGLLAALVAVPLVLIAIFYAIGKLFRAPRRFASILFVILFVAALSAAAYGYLRAGQASTATVTSMSERVVVDDALRSHHEFQVGVQTRDLGPRTISVPARIYDETAIGETIGVRAGSVLGLKLARAQDERITDLIGLGSLVCAVLVVLFAAYAAASRTARAPAILLTLGALAGIGIQPAIEATPLLGGTTMSAAASVTGVAKVGPASLIGMPAGFLRGPFSIDHRWMWANDQDLQFVAVTFTPAGGTTPVTAVDVIPKANTPAAGAAIQIQYETQSPRWITSDFSQGTQCAWILLGVLALIELVLLLIGIVVWRMRVRRRNRREAEQEAGLDRDVNQAIEVNTRRDGQPWPDENRPEPAYDAPAAYTAYDQPGYGQPGYDQPGYGQPGYDQPGYGQPAYQGREMDDETRPLRSVGPGMTNPRMYRPPADTPPPPPSHEPAPSSPPPSVSPRRPSGSRWASSPPPSSPPPASPPRAYERPASYPPPASYPSPATYPVPGEEEPPPAGPQPAPAPPPSRRPSF